MAIEINPIEKALELTNRAVDDIDTKGWAQIDFPINVDRGPIDLTGKFLLRSLQALNSKLTDSNYKFVLQCGYRQKDSMNCMISNVNEPLIEINTDDLRSLSINDGEEVSLLTQSAEIQIKCKAVDNLQSGLIRIANHAIINKLSNTKNRDYLNPQYKLVFANIRKINGIS